VCWERLTDRPPWVRPRCFEGTCPDTIACVLCTISQTLCVGTRFSLSLSDWRPANPHYQRIRRLSLVYRYYTTCHLLLNSQYSNFSFRYQLVALAWFIHSLEKTHSCNFIIPTELHHGHGCEMSTAETPPRSLHYQTRGRSVWQA
jgi:hypothetical protein